ncbi:MAG: hypothetical protein V1813_02450 [Candidatus Aenigmatarchaeota archaeon]
MADPLSSLDGILGGLDLSFANPVGLGVNIFLSTIIGGILILLIVEIFAKKFSESVNPMHAFLVSLVISVINLLGIIPILGGLVGTLPFAGMIAMLLPVIVWIALIKVFFRDLALTHALMIGVICYLMSIFLVPTIVVMVSAFIPF